MQLIGLNYESKFRISYVYSRFQNSSFNFPNTDICILTRGQAAGHRATRLYSNFQFNLQLFCHSSPVQLRTMGTRIPLVIANRNVWLGDER